jgi:hypothetical protein
MNLVIIVVGDRRRPGGAVRPAESRPPRGSMFAYAGTCTVDGEKRVSHQNISMYESWMGEDPILLYKLDSETRAIAAKSNSWSTKQVL